MKIELESGECRDVQTFFLAGPMRGIDEYNFPAFFAAAFSLECEGVDVYNPAAHDDARGWEWKNVKAADANGLPHWAQTSCDLAIAKSGAVVVLPGWADSAGAKREVELADRLGIPVLSYPSLVPISLVERELADVAFPYSENVKKRPKLFVVGHGRHGKDTFADMLTEKTGLVSCDSSRFACSNVVRPYIERVYSRTYATDDECYEDRHHCRSTWFDAIRDYNAKDPARLARELFRVADIYCGIRSRVEFFAARDLVDISIWVDASKRRIPESMLSFDILASDCDITIDNNGTEAELERRAERLAKLLRFRYAS